MNVYRLSELDLPVVEETIRIAREVAAPNAVEVDRAGRFPTETVDALGKAGRLGLCVATALGGKGRGLRAFAATAEAEALGERCGASAMVFVMHTAAQQAIAASSLNSRDDVQREMAAGRHLDDSAPGERGSRSHFWAPISQLQAHGDGFALTADKSWITSAHHAHSYVASAQRPGAASPLESTICFVPTKSSGVHRDRLFDGLGLRGNDPRR